MALTLINKALKPKIIHIYEAISHPAATGKRSEMVLAVGLFIKRSLITVHVSTNLRA